MKVPSDEALMAPVYPGISALGLSLFSATSVIKVTEVLSAQSYRVGRD